MKYTSTRNKNISVSFEEAICSGYASDGGLYIPQSLPSLNNNDNDNNGHFWNQWSSSSLSYWEVAYDLLRMFISVKEIPNDDLRNICQQSFTEGFENANDPVPVIPLKKNKKGEGDGSDDIYDDHDHHADASCFVVELFHGPTFCFKDLGMRVLVRFLSYFLTKRQKQMTLLVSTTGDTGPAAVRAVSDDNNNDDNSCQNNNYCSPLSILVHYPHNQISTFQRRQLTTVHSKRVKVATFEGGGDDMDWPIKQLLNESAEFNNNKKKKNNNDSGGGKSDHNDDDDDDDNVEKGAVPTLCGVNSYNIGRPLVQMIHFVWTYLQVMQYQQQSQSQSMIPPLGDPDYTIDIILPTGAMGNIVGGYMAKLMGTPIGKLCAGVNINDITHRVFTKGQFHKSDRMEKTLSDAINIQVPYNFERLLFYLSNQDHDLVKSYMIQMEQTQKVNIIHNLLTKMQRDFGSARITDDDMCHTLRCVHQKYGYYICPHTAVAFATAERLGYGVLKSIKPSCARSKDDELSLLERKRRENNNFNDNVKDNEEDNIMPTTNHQRPFAILATASPCKFQESMTVAMGTEGWDDYYQHAFPKRAKDVMEAAMECTPTFYPWKEECSLEENQLIWTDIARAIVKDFECVG